jgi:hypothetical protein
MRKIYTRPELDIVKLDSTNDTMLTKSAATVVAGNKGVYKTTTYSVLQ